MSGPNVDLISDELRKPLIELLLSVADDKFILGHRNADWTGLAPILEEDIAFSSLSQDELAHASALYQMIAGLTGSQADRIAYSRKASEYRCAAIVELSDDFNWATAICRNFFCDHFDRVRLARLAASSYKPLAQLAARLAAEETIHVEHIDAWIKRFGHGGEDARSRIQSAFDSLSPLALGLFEPTEGQERLESTGVYPDTEPNFFDRWRADITAVTDAAGFTLSVVQPNSSQIGGRRGKHCPQFEALLDELTEVYRLEPEAAW